MHGWIEQCVPSSMAHISHVHTPPGMRIALWRSAREEHYKRSAVLSFCHIFPWSTGWPAVPSFCHIFPWSTGHIFPWSTGWPVAWCRWGRMCTDILASLWDSADLLPAGYPSLWLLVYPCLCSAVYPSGWSAVLRASAALGDVEISELGRSVSWACCFLICWTGALYYWLRELNF